MSSEHQIQPRTIELRRFRARGHLVLAEDDILKCAISDISDKAATLVIEAERELPQEFALEFEGNVSVHRMCKLVSQNGNVAKVSFPFRTPQPHKRNVGLV
ncbi:hypothetical protein IZ6_16230 [Terrihabitans soli]|uniref:PilZ domain-containing protein n=1 Tax=Terrihabitans soli TaxID=708113 RepID=A0A6S6QWJ0_9HYPH|nr:hypothetical protein [Terrihabitans soli]BCJ90888.1 hypothetical protein IZ6_16230 [Terrihabitans soli]